MSHVEPSLGSGYRTNQHVEISRSNVDRLGDVAKNLGIFLFLVHSISFRGIFYAFVLKIKFLVQEMLKIDVRWFTHLERNDCCNIEQLELHCLVRFSFVSI